MKQWVVESEWEEWKPILGYGLAYQISTYGRVWSPGRHGKGRFLKPGIASHGYPTVALGRGNTRSIHALVAEAFVGPRPVDCEVLHKDGCRVNPVYGNLRYGTRSDNMLDAKEHGTLVADVALAAAARTPASYLKGWRTRRASLVAKGVQS